MALETYTLSIEENQSNEGIDADVYGEDGTIETTARAPYGDYALETARDDGAPDPIERQVTADVLRLDLQIQRDGGGFLVRLLGDDEELLRERVDDDDWGLATVEE